MPRALASVSLGDRGLAPHGPSASVPRRHINALLQPSELHPFRFVLRFETARHEQGRATRHRHGAEFAMDGGRVVLPFVRVARADQKPAQVGTTRRDVVSLPQPHFPRLRVGRADG